jgi:hypothetical protein
MTAGTLKTGYYDVSYQYSSNYTEKTWSGTDRPTSTKQRYERIDTSYKETFLRVRRNKELIKIKYHNRFLMRRIKPPARALHDDPHPYSCDIRWFNFPRLNHYWDPDYRMWFPLYPGTLGQCNPLTTSSWTTNDDLVLIGKLREKVAGSDFNAGVFLGEGHEALNMIRNAATRIYWGYRAAKHGDFRSARRYLVNGSDRSKLGRKSVANNWLELQYGWLPLLKDAESGAQFLAHHFSSPLAKEYRVRHVRKDGTLTTSSQINTEYKNTQVINSGQIIARLTEKDVISLVGLTDPLSVAWELLPYSFVIDWFIPIGNFLAARGLSQSLTGTFITTRYDSYKANGWYCKTAAIQDSSSADSDAFKIIKVRRSVSSTLEVPVPTFKPLNKVLSWKHCANAVALLSNLH